MLLRKLAPTCLVALATACSGAVIVEPVPDAPQELRGDLTLTWTLAGRADGDVCAFYAASELQVDLYEAAGPLITSEFPPCEDFQVTFDLPEGVYDASVTLLDPSGRRISTTLDINDLSVLHATEITSDIDFPRDSIF